MKYILKWIKTKYGSTIFSKNNGQSGSASSMSGMSNDGIYLYSTVCSTDNVWYKTNMEMSSSEKFDAIDSNITSLQGRKQTQIIRMTSLQILSRRWIKHLHWLDQVILFLLSLIHPHWKLVKHICLVSVIFPVQIRCLIVLCMLFIMHLPELFLHMHLRIVKIRQIIQWLQAWTVKFVFLHSIMVMLLQNVS